MFDFPKTLEEARQYRYFKWAGNPKGTAYKEGNCAYKCHEQGRGIHFYQCKRKNGYEPNGLYCKQHSKMIKKEE